MRPEPAVRGTALVGLGLLAFALLRPEPEPYDGPVVRVGDRWDTLENAGAAVFADVRDGDTVRVYAGWGLPVRAPAPVEWSVDPGPVSLNHASMAQLEGLPGIGPALARRIVDARPFARVRQLDDVRGIGPKKMAALVSLVAP
jgi:competence protein ComEA